MIDLSYKIKNSTPTITGSEATRAVNDLLSDDRFVLFSSEILGLNAVIVLADNYCHGMATLEVPGQQPLVTLQPAHVLYDKIQYPDRMSEMWALVYSNGSVIYAEKTNETGLTSHWYVLMDRVLADEHNLEYRKISYGSE